MVIRIVLEREKDSNLEFLFFANERHEIDLGIALLGRLADHLERVEVEQVLGVEHVHEQVHVLGKGHAEHVLHLDVALALGIERLLVELLALDGLLRLVELLEGLGQTLVDVREHLLTDGRELVDELLVGVACAVLVAPVHDPVLVAARKALLEALEELAALELRHVAVRAQVFQTLLVQRLLGRHGLLLERVEHAVRSRHALQHHKQQHNCQCFRWQSHTTFVAHHSLAHITRFPSSFRFVSLCFLHVC